MAVKKNHIKGGTSKAHSAFTLIELIVVIAIMSVIVLLPGIRLVSLLTKSSFKAQAHQFVTTMQAAVTAAAENGKKYEVIIDLVEQTYTLREITSPDLTEVLEEEIIAENDFGKNVWQESSMENNIRDLDVPALVIHDVDDVDVPWHEGQSIDSENNKG